MNNCLAAWEKSGAVHAFSSGPSVTALLKGSSHDLNAETNQSAAAPSCDASSPGYLPAIAASALCSSPASSCTSPGDTCASGALAHARHNRCTPFVGGTVRAPAHMPSGYRAARSRQGSQGR